MQQKPVYEQSAADVHQLMKNTYWHNLNLNHNNAFVDMNKIKDVCNKSAIKDFVESLPNNYYQNVQ